MLEFCVMLVFVCMMFSGLETGKKKSILHVDSLG